MQGLDDLIKGFTMRQTDKRVKKLNAHRSFRNAEKRAKSMRVSKPKFGVLKVGMVVRVEINYAEGVGSKVRPALVLGVDGDQVQVRAFTSSAQSAGPDGVAMEPSNANGLTRPCYLRSNAITVSANSILGSIGRLPVEILLDIPRAVPVEMMVQSDQRFDEGVLSLVQH